MTYQSNNNAVLYDDCAPLRNLSLVFEVVEDLATVEGNGFSLQLNAYPPPGRTSQGQPLIIFQYMIYILNNSVWYEIQYWASGNTWPNGYTPQPGTTPWLPVLPNDYYLTPFGSAPANQILRGSRLGITLGTDDSAAVVSAQFSYTDPDGNLTSSTFQFPEGARYPISAFEMDLVGPGGGSNCTFTTGLTASRGIFYYSVSPGTLSVQPGGPGSACGEWSGGTAETSNAVYSDISPASGGTTVTQTLGQPVDCAVNNLAQREAGGHEAASDAGERLRRVRDTTVADSPSGLWLTELLDRHAAELAGLLARDPDLSRESWALLQRAEAIASTGAVFDAELVEAADGLVQRASAQASSTVAAAAVPLRMILHALRGRTLDEGLKAASRTSRPRQITPA